MDNKVELLKEAIDLIPRMDDSDPIAPALRDWVDKARKETLEVETNRLHESKKSFVQSLLIPNCDSSTQLQYAKNYIRELEEYAAYLEDEITYIRGG